jgi:hypothetical protein
MPATALRVKCRYWKSPGARFSGSAVDRPGLTGALWLSGCLFGPTPLSSSAWPTLLVGLLRLSYALPLTWCASLLVMTSLCWWTRVVCHVSWGR